MAAIEKENHEVLKWGKGPRGSEGKEEDHEVLEFFFLPRGFGSVAPTDARNRRSETFRTFTEMLL